MIASSVARKKQPNSHEFIHIYAFACWVSFHALVVVCRLFSKLTFSKNSFGNTIKVSNGLDPDQDRHSVCPDLGPNCLRRLSVAASKERVKWAYL